MCVKNTYVFFNKNCLSFFFNIIGSNLNEFNGSAKREVSLATAFALQAADEAIADADWYPACENAKERTGLFLVSL